MSNDFNDMVGEITKNQQFQNSVDDLIEKEKEMDNIIANVTSKESFQNNVDDLIEKEKEMDNIVANVTSKESFQNNVDNLISENKKEEEQPNNNEEIKYMSSQYYRTYLHLINNANLLVNQIVTNLLQKYNINSVVFNNPFHEKISTTLVINNIGFPVPERFLNNYEEILQQEFSSYDPEEGTFQVKLIPLEYTEVRNSSVLKKINTYQINISLQRKSKVKKIEM